MTEKEWIKVQRKYEDGIYDYDSYLSSTKPVHIDKIIVTKIIKNKKGWKNQKKIFDIVKFFTFRKMQKTYVVEKGVLIFPNTTVYITHLDPSHIRYIANIYNHYEVVSIKISDESNPKVEITKIRLRSSDVKKPTLFVWKSKQKNRLKQIHRYLKAYKNT